MEPVLIDSEWLAATLPDGFDRIPHDELEAIMNMQYDLMWGVHDKERHMLMCVTWKDSNKFLTKLVREKSFAKRIHERNSLVCMKRSDTSNYRRNGLTEREVSGASALAHGFRFSYTLKGVDQEGEVLVFKRDIRCYTLLYYTRSEYAEQNRPVFEDILASLEVR